jgi:hypothetical protein
MRGSVELKNIPVSISILHEHEYHNLCKMLQMKRIGNRYVRRSFSERVSPTHSKSVSYSKIVCSFLEQ